MSPEQAGRIDAGVDTRTDVYSLGVLLYELLTGHHPRDLRAARSALDQRRPPAERSGGADADAAARRGRRRRARRSRQSTPQRLRRRLAGDLDTVVLKAIELEPDRRYDSVEQFADDVRRVIAGEPVRAKPPTWTYRTRRFVRRHRVPSRPHRRRRAVLAGGAGCSPGSAWRAGARARSRPRGRAPRRPGRAAANQVTDFLIGLFEVANPDQAGGRS